MKGRKRDSAVQNVAEAAHSITTMTITVLGRLVILATRRPAEADTDLIAADMSQVEAESWWRKMTEK